MDSLPDDLKCKIFQELDAVHLCRLSVVSKSTGILSDNPESWKIVHGSSKDEAKELHLKNSENTREASLQLEKYTTELSNANARALHASKEMEKIDSRTFRKKTGDIPAHVWNAYNAAVSNLGFAEDLLEEAETNFEKADLEHWRVNGIAKADSKKLRVPLRLRQKAEQALAEWKIADLATRKLNPVCAGYLTAREKMGWKNIFEKERSAWWVARIAFREISRWEGNTTSADILGDVVGMDVVGMDVVGSDIGL
jgi:hypothetical protein